MRATGAARLVHDDRVAGLPHRAQQRRGIERLERAQVDHLGLDAVVRQGVGRLQAMADRLRVRDDREVDALANDLGAAERDDVLARRHVARRMGKRQVHEEEDRVVVADRCLEQALEVGRARRHHDLQPRGVDEHRLEVVVVLAADAPAGAGHRQDDEREAELAAGEIAKLAGAVDERVHRQRQERREQQVDDRAQPHRGGADGGAGDDRLGERRVADARGAELGDELGPLGRDAFAEHDDARVAAHLLGDRLGNRLLDDHLVYRGGRGGHGRVPRS
jgi:hypothetical protein